MPLDASQHGTAGAQLDRPAASDRAYRRGRCELVSSGLHHLPPACFAPRHRSPNPRGPERRQLPDRFSGSAVIRSRCRRFLTVFGSGTRCKYTTGNSVPRHEIEIGPARSMSPIVYPSASAQNGASASGITVSIPISMRTGHAQGSSHLLTTPANARRCVRRYHSTPE